MNFLVFLRLGIIKKWNEIVALIRKSFIEFCAWFHIVCVCVHFTSFNNRRPLTFEKFGTALIPLAYSVWGWVGVGGDYGPPLHNSVFWGVFLGLQPSGAAARLCVPAEWFQRILLTTVANTQPERAVQYGMDAIATASFKEGIQTYNNVLIKIVLMGKCKQKS